jgi:hypothetical protein
LCNQRCLRSFCLQQQIFGGKTQREASNTRPLSYRDNWAVLSLRYLVVAVLIGAWPPIQGALAKDTPAAAKSAGSASKGEHDKNSKGANEAAPRVNGGVVDHKAGHEATLKGPTPKGETPKGASSATKGDTEVQPIASKEGEPTGLGPIETPVPEQPKHVVQPPVKIGPAKTIPQPTNKPTPDSGVVVRNAIGANVPSEAITRLRQGPPLRPGSAVGAAGVVTGNADNIRTAAPKSPQGPGPGILPAGNRGLDGAAIGHLGHGPAIVSGVAKPLAQINGSTIRSKH